MKKNYSLINCIATSFLAYIFTIPLHEFFHMATHWIYGDKVLSFSAGAVNAVSPDYTSMSAFDVIMDAGGSASILNAIIGIILLIILLKVNMGPTMRVFLTQLMGAHFAEGIGYFMIGGFFGAGDWGNVFEALSDRPTVALVLRIGLVVVGSLGIVAEFFILNYMSRYYIEDYSNKKDRLAVGFKLHLIVLISGFTVGMIISVMSPFEGLGALMGFLYNLVWIPFLWGFLFTGPMKVLPPKKSMFLYKLPEEPKVALWIIGLVLILADIFVLGPGIIL